LFGLVPAENRIFKIIGIFIIHAYRELSPIAAWILIFENKYASGLIYVKELLFQ
jgi:hypothetical protein